MGRRATGTVEARTETIRLKFTHRGARCVETLDLAPTPPNLKAAERLLARVVSAIDAGVYERGAFFQARAGEASSVTTFKDYAEDWLKSLTQEKSTRRSYKSALNGTWYPALGDKRLVEIKHSDLARIIGEKAKGSSGKTINNVLIPLRRVLEAAIRDDLIQRNPADGLKNLPHQVTPPDPLEADERDAVVAYMAGKYPAQVAHYFAFALHTGLRPSEQIALCWSDVDWNRKQVRVSKARVDWEEKGTKTNSVRDVDLSDVAVACLVAMKTHTFMKNPEGPIFENPITGRPWPDEQVQRRRYWTPALRALGMRQRDAYQCRHTFATVLLMGGVNPAYIARQLGHTNAQMLFRVYAKWIDGADKGAEAAKANAILSPKSPSKAEAV